MHTTNLITALAEEIRDATSNLKLPVEYQDETARQLKDTWVNVNIFEQQIPRDLFQETAYYPCCIVEFLSLSDNLKSGSIATVGLSLGVFAKEFDGWQDAFHLMEVVRERLLTRRLIAKKFRLTEEVVWQTAQEQPAPFFFVYGELNYEIFFPQEKFL